MSVHLLVVDTETGGLDSACHPLLEIGAVLVDHCLNEVGRFHALVRPHPGLTLDPESLAVTGLDPHMLQREGLPEPQALTELLTFVSTSLAQGQVILAGWNISFDQAFLSAAFRRHGLPWPFGHRSMDIQSVWSFVTRWDFGGLTAVCKRLFGSEPPHRAMSDAAFALEVLRACSARSAPVVL